MGVKELTKSTHCRRDVPLWRRRAALRGSHSRRHGCAGGYQAHYAAAGAGLGHTDLQRNGIYNVCAAILSLIMCGSGAELSDKSSSQGR